MGRCRWRTSVCSSVIAADLIIRSVCTRASTTASRGLRSTSSPISVGGFSVDSLRSASTDPTSRNRCVPASATPRRNRETASTRAVRHIRSIPRKTAFSLTPSHVRTSSTTFERVRTRAKERGGLSQKSSTAIFQYSVFTDAVNHGRSWSTAVDDVRTSLMAIDVGWWRQWERYRNLAMLLIFDKVPRVRTRSNDVKDVRTRSSACKGVSESAL